MIPLVRPAALIYAAAVATLVAGFCFDESTCLWYVLTGWHCPGCGMIHALLALGRGDVFAAWDYNPRSVVVAPLLAYAGLSTLKERIR
jgi:hypothetical protein